MSSAHPAPTKPPSYGGSATRPPDPGGLIRIADGCVRSRDTLATRVGFELDVYADYPSVDFGTHTLRV